MTNWHVEADALQRYLDDHISAAEAASVEAHVVACAACQADLASADVAVADGRLDATWDSIRATVLTPRPLPLERILHFVGMPSHLSRVVGATRGQIWSWVIASAALLALASAANSVTDTALTRYSFVVFAPLIPLAAVAAVYAPTSDPLRELVRSSPVGAQGILMLRVVIVLCGVIGVLGGLSVALPDAVASAVWLLPALTLSVGSVLLSAWMPVQRAAGGLAGTWVIAAMASLVRGGPVSGAAGDILDRFVAFRPTGQLFLMAIFTAALSLLYLLSDKFDLEGAMP